MLNRLLPTLPIWIVLADLVYGFFTNSVGGLIHASKGQTHISDGIPLSPDIAFNGLQVLVNGSMVCVMIFGLWTLLKLNRTVAQKEVMPLGIFRTLGLATVLIFSLPACWEWFWAILSLIQGIPAISWSSPRYLLVAWCLPWIGLICIWRLFGWYQLHQHQPNIDEAV